MIFHFQCILLIIEGSYKKKAQKQCRQAKPNFEQKPQSYLFVLLFAFWLPLHLVCFFGLKFFRCLGNCIPVVCFVTISRFSWAWKHSTCKQGYDMHDKDSLKMGKWQKLLQCIWWYAESCKNQKHFIGPICSFKI